MGRIRTAGSFELSRWQAIQERSSSPRLHLIFLLTMLAGGAACSGGSEGAGEPVPDCTPPVRATRIPPDIEALGLERWGTITKSEARAGFLGAAAVSEQEVVEIYPDMVRRLGGSYTFLGGDNEGFEAELSFVDREDRVISFTLTEIACDKVLIKVLFEKSAA